MCTYNLGRANKRKGFGDFWEAKRGLTRCDIGGEFPVPSFKILDDYRGF